MRAYIWVWMILIVACSENNQPEPDDSPARADFRPNVVATLNDDEITYADFEAHIVGLPVDQRPKSGEPLAGWYRDVLDSLATERVMLLKANQSELAASQDFREHEQRARVQIGLSLCLQDQLKTQFDQITEDSLRAIYSEKADAFAKDELRLVSHIYLRASPSTSRQEVEEALTELRDRVLGGENFGNLAKEYSDSESRHRNGSLGWLERGGLPQKASETVFSLDEGVPSLPVISDDGGHIFMVDTIMPRRRVAFDEVKNELLGMEQQRIRKEVLAELAELADIDLMVADQETVRAAMSDGDQAALVFESDSVGYSLGEIVVSIRSKRSGNSGSATPVTLAQVLGAVRELEQTYKAHNTCLAKGYVSGEALQEALGNWEEQALITMHRSQAMKDVVESNPALLEKHFEDNKHLYASPPKWQLKSIYFEVDEDAPALMQRLEAAASEDAVAIEDLAAQFEAEVVDNGWLSQAEMTRISKSLPSRVAPAQPGSLIAPYRVQGNIAISEVVGYREGEEATYESVADQVAQSFLQDNVADIYAKLQSNYLAAANYQVNDDAIQTHIEAGLRAGRDVSVEELDALIEQL